VNNFQHSAIIVSLIEKLHEHGSWCGETHVQKAAYLLKEIFSVPIDEFDFVLYKHGPYSFELTDHLARMRSQSLLKLIPQVYPYRPSIGLDDGTSALKRMYAKTILKYSDQIDFVAGVINNKGVSDLEKLATALYVTKELGPKRKAEERAAALREYKSHV